MGRGLNHGLKHVESPAIVPFWNEAKQLAAALRLWKEQLQQMDRAMTRGDLGIVGDYLLIMIIVYILMFGCLTYQVPKILFARVNPFSTHNLPNRDGLVGYT